jgi:hypothetical protein
MNGCEWIVCETTSRWAAALRLALDRDPQLRAGGVRLYETRLLGDLSARVAQRPDGFVAIEVHDRNAADVLAWLSGAVGRYHQARFVALVDHSLSAGRRDLEDTLREAGALEIACSPRHLQAIVELYRRHAALSNVAAASLAADRPLEEQVWALLPWQAEPTRVG